MRILVIADFSAQFPGSFILSQVYLARKIIQKGGEIFYIFPRYKTWMQSFKGIAQLFFIDSFEGKRFDLILIKKCLEVIKKYNIQIVHTHFGLSSPVAGVIISRVTRVKHIWHWRNPPASLVRNGKPLLKKILARYLYKSMELLGNNHYIAISKDIKNSLVQHGYLPASKIIVVNNAIDIQKFSRCQKKNPEVIEKIIGKRLSNKKIIGMIAHFGPQKDHITFIKSAKLVVEEFPHAIFLLVGGELSRNRKNGWMEKVKSITRRLCLQNNVYFLGPIEHPEEIIKGLDIGVLISNWEGFGNTIVEYMAAKKPVIATNVGGIKEIIIDKKTGFLIPPKDYEELARKIILLLRNKRLAEIMGEEGYRRAQKKFSIENWVDRMIKIYTQIADKNDTKGCKN